MWKICSCCGNNKPNTTEYFYKDISHKDGLTSVCKDCRRVSHSAYAKANRHIGRCTSARYRASHGDRIRESLSAYQKSHPEIYTINKDRRRVRELGLPHLFTTQDWITCLTYFDSRCAVCGKPGSEFKLTADHWIPIVSPNCPGSIPSNIVPLCHGKGGCNNKKRAFDPDVWLIKTFGEQQAAEILARVNRYFKAVTP